MLRFIEIGDQIYEEANNFAWYDTVTSQFKTFYENQIWETWHQFLNDYIHDKNYDENNYYCIEGIKRYRSLYDGNRHPVDGGEDESKDR